MSDLRSEDTLVAEEAQLVISSPDPKQTYDMLVAQYSLIQRNYATTLLAKILVQAMIGNAAAKDAVLAIAAK